MTERTPGAASLPDALPIFPLAGVLLLPGGRLPLNIFEPRYLDMVRDAMGGHRMIGMVQPTDPHSRAQRPAVYRTGGAGRVTSFRETDDGRFLITLTGISRFRIAEELDVLTRYRQVVPDWACYRDDPAVDEAADGIDRARLLPALQAYLKLSEIPADWSAIEKAPVGPLVNYLSMICPFAPSEKQALLEASDVLERARVMTALIEMAVLQCAGGSENPDGRSPH